MYYNVSVENVKKLRVIIKGVWSIQHQCLTSWLHCFDRPDVKTQIITMYLFASSFLSLWFVCNNSNFTININLIESYSNISVELYLL